MTTSETSETSESTSSGAHTTPAFNTPDTEKMNDEIFLAYLREYKPYLFDIESAIIQISEDAGYGEVIFNLRIMNGLVEKGTASLTMDKLYVRRNNNRL